MKLNIKDRLYITQLLPANGNFMEYALKRSITGKVALTKEEQEKYEIREMPEENKLVWNSEMDAKEPVNVDFTSEEIGYLKKSCEAVIESPHSDDFWHTVEKIYNS